MPAAPSGWTLRSDGLAGSLLSRDGSCRTAGSGSCFLRPLPGEGFSELRLLVIPDQDLCCGDLIRYFELQFFLKMRSPEYSGLRTSIRDDDSYVRRHWNSARKISLQEEDKITAFHVIEQGSPLSHMRPVMKKEGA